MDRPSSSPFRDLHEQLRAKKLLAYLNVHEKSASDWDEQQKIRASLTADQKFWHDQLAKTLRRATGVSPDRRAELRLELEKFLRDGGPGVDAIYAAIDGRDQANGASSAAGEVDGAGNAS